MNDANCATFLDRGFALAESGYSRQGWALEDPVLAVHTAYDPGVPPRLANAYHVTVTLQGCEKLFVHKYVEAEGHCNIAPDLVGMAFDELRKWAAEGIRPEPGVLR